eukprot:30294-Pelagococcus_subviridis.AAC.16
MRFSASPSVGCRADVTPGTQSHIAFAAISGTSSIRMIVELCLALTSLSVCGSSTSETSRATLCTTHLTALAGDDVFGHPIASARSTNSSAASSFISSLCSP